MTVDVRIANIDEIERFLPALEPGMRAAAMEAAEDMVLDADRIAKKRARSKAQRPFPRTRRYLNSIHPVIQKTTRQVNGAIASDVRYAPFLEFGTPPHVIRPRRKQALWWPGAAHPVKRVRHPGTPAYRVLGDAADEVVDDIAKYARRAVERFVRRRGKP